MPANGTKRVRPGRRLSLRQVLDFQEITHEVALGLRGDFNGTSDREERARVAGALANLGKAFVSLQDAKREILGKPKAGVLKPESPKSKRGAAHVWAEPSDVWEGEPAEPPPAEPTPEAPQSVAASAPPSAPKPTASQPEAPPISQPSKPKTIAESLKERGITFSRPFA